MPPSSQQTSSSSSSPFLSPTLHQLTSKDLTAVYIVGISFVIIILITCGILRARRTSLASLRSHLPAALPPNPPPRRAGKTIRVHSFLPRKGHAKGTCPICLELLGEAAVSEGTCAHPLHTKCLVQWLMRDPMLSCPVCRATFQSVTPKRARSEAADDDDEEEEEEEDFASLMSELKETELLSTTEQIVDVLEDPRAPPETPADAYDRGSASTERDGVLQPDQIREQPEVLSSRPGLEADQTSAEITPAASR